MRRLAEKILADQILEHDRVLHEQHLVAVLEELVRSARGNAHVLATEQSGREDPGVAVVGDLVVAAVHAQPDHGLEQVHVVADLLHPADRHAGHRDRRADFQATDVLVLRDQVV
jgi:hypothetical protein